jgi:WYL_2, Sm-like SH3 beta-barrel fold
VDMTNSKNTSTLAPDFELDASKRAIASLLRQHEAIITFTKKDGTQRVMKCTLKEGVVVPHEKTTDRVKEPKPDILPVWDIEAQAWRSVTIPNILTVEI